MQGKALVLDANILIRAVLGERVRRILETHAENISFFVPEAAYTEAGEHLAVLLSNMAAIPRRAKGFEGYGRADTIVGNEIYGEFEGEARKRLGARDPEDWPILAAALALGCPIWMEDTDFFTSSDVVSPLEPPPASTSSLLSSSQFAIVPAAKIRRFGC